MDKTHLNLKSHWPLTLFSSFAAVCNLALPLILARVFTPEQMGEYKIFFLYLVLMPWVTLSAGIGNGLYYWVNQGDYKKYFQVSWTLLFYWASLVSLLLLVFVQGQALGFWFAAGTFLLLISSFHEEALIATGLTWRGALFSSLSEILRSALVIGVTVLTHQLLPMIQAYVFVLLIKVLLGVYFGRKMKFQKMLNLFSLNREMAVQILKYAVPVSFASLIAVFTHYADQLFLSHASDARYFAGYALGCLTIPPLNSFEQAVNRVLIPALSKEKAVLFKNAISELSWILIPATTGLLIFAGPIVVLIFTEKYDWIAPFLRLYAFNYLLLAFPYDAWARARGDGKWILKNLLIAVGSALFFLPVLIHFYQGVGALIGLFCTQLSLRIGGFMDVRKTTSWKLTEFIPFQDLAYQLSLCVLLSLLSFGASYELGTGIRWFIVCAPLFAFIYLSFTLKRRLKLHFEEREVPAVLHLTQYLEMGGLERVIQSLCYFNRQRLFESFVSSYDQRSHAHSLKAQFESFGVQVFSYQKKRGFSLVFLFKLLKILYQKKIRLIHTHDLGPLVYATFAKMMMLGTLRIVHTQHSFVHLNKKLRYRFYENFFTRFANQVVVISKEAEATYLKLGVNAKKIKRIQNGVFFIDQVIPSEDEKIEARKKWAPALSPHSLWILYLARIHSQKGQLHALELLSKLPEAVKNKLQVIFVGQESSEGELDHLKSIIKKFQLEKQVYFAGLSDVPMKWHQLSDVFLSLSEFEGMPLSPIEAFGSGLPLVLSKIPGHDMLPYESFWFHLPLRESEIQNFNSFILEMSKKTVQDRVRAFEAAHEWREKYGIDHMALQYLALYQKVMKA